MPKKTTNFMALLLVSALVSTFISLSVSHVIADPRPAVKEIVATAFHLVDKHGNHLASFAKAPDGTPGLYLKDSKGRVVAYFAVVKDDPTLVFIGADGKSKIYLDIIFLYRAT